MGSDLGGHGYALPTWPHRTCIGIVRPQIKPQFKASIVPGQIDNSSVESAFMWAEHYSIIKLAHVGLVVLSGLIFASRGALTLAGKRLAKHPALRYASYLIDTSLLLAAVLLMSILHLYPQTSAWLALKLVLLLAYIVLGVMALRRARTRSARAIYFVAAIATYLSMVGIARAHHPLGWLRLWGWL